MLAHEYKTIFVHVPKTGGQSIELVFLNKLGLTWETRAPLLLRPTDDPTRGPDRLAHLFAREYVSLGYVDAETFAAYFKFSVVRNPWARMVSLYKFSSQKLGVTFAQFLDENVRRGILLKSGGRGINPQKTYLYAEDGSLLVDRVLRFETLSKDFAEVSRVIFGQEEPLPERNVSPDRTDYREFYDSAGRDLIAEKFRDDIETFGYRFDDGN